jgi:hypothetical protein
MPIATALTRLTITILVTISATWCGGSDRTSAQFVPAACTPDRYILSLLSSSPVAANEPQRMQLLINCGGNVDVVPNVAIDWTVATGGGTVNGTPTTRTTTNASGISEVTWRFGPIDEMQSIEARLTATPSLHAGLSRTVLAVGANPCAAAGGTNVGDSRTISTDETWTKAGSPYFNCPGSTPCAGEVAVTNGAVLTIEPGVAVCLNKIRAVDGGRIVAAGTAAERVYIGVRDRSQKWTGIVLEPPSGGTAITSASLLRHVVIENPESIDVSGHPIFVEDTLVRRDPAVSKGSTVCGTFAIRQHTIAGIPPSRIARTILDGMGSFSWPWDYWYGCPALWIEVTDQSPPLVASARVINSWGPGVGLFVSGAANSASETQLTDCEISGSAEVGLFVSTHGAASLPVITKCNVFGNASAGIHALYIPQTQKLDVRGNWWGDPVGPQGRQGDGVLGSVDASNPLAAPLNLGY